MIRKLIALGMGGAAALVAFTVSEPAQAQGTVSGDRIDSEGIKLIFSADRLFGLNWHKYTVTREYVRQPGANGNIEEYSYSNTSFALLWPSVGPISDIGIPNISAIPRLSFDAKVFMGLTVGGSLGFMMYSGTYSHEKTRGNALQPNLDYSGNAFVLSPRVGWVMMFTDLFGLWPRGSINYYTAKNETSYLGNQGQEKDKTTIWGMGFSLEVPMILAPTSHFAFTAGPVFDIYPWGKSDTEHTPPDPTPPQYPLKETRVSFMNLGFTFGMLGHF